jgi:hypothetical protein
MDKGTSVAWVAIFACCACVAMGCGKASSSDKASPDASLDGTNGGGHDSGVPNLGGGDGGLTQTLTIQPQNSTLAVGAPGVTQQFQATIGGQPVNAQWTLDTAGIGTIDANGLFTASGVQGGTVEVSANGGGQMGQTALTVVLQLTENPSNISPTTQGQLQAGGMADPGFAWLYPYDQTVFPRDLPAPTLQFAAGADAGAPGFDAAMVKVTFGGLNYTGFYGPAAAPSQIPLTATAWQAITQSASGTDAVKVQVTKIAGGQVSGPITETWTIATGSLRGSIFYNSYNSALAGNTGAVLKLRPSEQLLSVVVSTNGGGTCHVCHAVAANGSILEAADEGSGASQDSVWSLTADGGTLTPLYSAPDRTWDFGAFTPDGTKFLRYGAVPWTAGAWAPDVRGMGNSSTDVPSDLFNPLTGASLNPIGLDAGPAGAQLNMMMPSFSPDGKMVAFNHYDTGTGHTIAVMNFDTTTNTFSNLRDVATLPASLYAGWPTFTPDDQYLLFAGGTDPEYDTLSDSPPNPPEPTSNIYIAHIPSGTIATADMLNGVSAGKSYLPFPDDPNLNYEPTILPVASGGYYWAVFTTRRNYGNTINGDPYAGAAGAPSPRKKLWVSAISIALTGGESTPPTMATDITHPAFYLDGQELTPGNMRAFWALDPCEQNGTTCQAGDQCCTGFCRQTTTDAGAAFVCVPPSGCAQANEKCVTASDCCGAAQGYQCINGFCAQPSPQ